MSRFANPLWMLLLVTTVQLMVAESNVRRLAASTRFHRRLLNTYLGIAVDKEYQGKLTEKIEDAPIEYEKSDRNLGELNKKHAHLLFDGDMLISPRFLRQMISTNRPDEAETQRNREEDEEIERGIVLGRAEADGQSDRRRRRDGKEEADTQRRDRRQAYRDRYYPTTIWQDGIPYEFDPALPEIAVTSLKRAMEFWQSESCVTFKPRKNETQYLYYTGADEGCYSTVGRDTTQPQQLVNIGSGCYHFGITSHEVAHAIGLFHHQQRPDRDDYVTFKPENFPSEYLQNFAKIPDRFLSNYSTPYDVGSVMHYTPTEFAIDRFKPALEAVDPNLQGTMGSMDQPSFLDVELVNRHYVCAALCVNVTTPPLCLNGGYQDILNCTQCKCPSGFGGVRCQSIESSAPMKCGGLLPASYKLQRIKIRLQAGPVRRQCVYQIRAPPNRRLMVGIEHIEGKCQEGCYSSGMEIKMRADYRPVGYRFCCLSHSFRRLVSRSVAAPLIFFATNGTMEATLYYRWIVTTPDAEDTNRISEKEMKEVYSQKSDLGLDMQVFVAVNGTNPDVFVPPFSDNNVGDRQKSASDSEILLGEIGSDGTSDVDFSRYGDKD